MSSPPFMTDRLAIEELPEVIITAHCVECAADVTGPVGVCWIAKAGRIGLEFTVQVAGHAHVIARVPLDRIPVNKPVPMS